MNEAKLLTEAIKDLQENYRILGNKQYRVRNKQYTVTKISNNYVCKTDLAG